MRIQGRINARTRTHDGMELVNEEDNLAIFLNIVDDIVHPLLKIPPENGFQPQHSSGQFQDPHTRQASRHLTFSYSLG